MFPAHTSPSLHSAQWERSSVIGRKADSNEMVSVCASSSLHPHLGRVFCVTQVAHRFGAFVSCTPDELCCNCLLLCSAGTRDLQREEMHPLLRDRKQTGMSSKGSVPETEASWRLAESSESLEIPLQSPPLGLGGCWTVTGNGEQSKEPSGNCCGIMACVWAENRSGTGGSASSSSHVDGLEEAAESKLCLLYCFQGLARLPPYLWFMHLLNMLLICLREGTHCLGIKAGKCFWKNRRCAGCG